MKSICFASWPEVVRRHCPQSKPKLVADPTIPKAAFATGSLL